MLDLGFSELSMEPVVCAEGDPSALTEADLPIVMEQYEKLAELMLKRDEEGRPFTLENLLNCSKQKKQTAFNFENSLSVLFLKSTRDGRVNT